MEVGGNQKAISGGMWRVFRYKILPPCWHRSTQGQFTKIYIYLVCFNRGISSSTPHHELTWSRMNHGGLPSAALHGGSPSPYTFDTCDLNFLPNIWSTSMVHSPDPLEDTLKRPITTIPPSITTTHHDGGLPSPLSYTLAL